MDNRKPSEAFSEDKPWKRVLLLPIIIALVLSVLAVASPFSKVYSAVNESINFQGKLVNSDGTNISDGNYYFKVDIYNDSAGGSSLAASEYKYSGTISSVTDTSVVYSGDTDESTIKAGMVLWNTTDGDYAIIESVDTGTNTITVDTDVDSGDFAWGASDAITTRIQLSDGIFNIKIVNISSLDFDSDSYYVQVQFDSTPGGGDTLNETFTPRKRLGSVAYAMRSKYSDELGGITSGQFLRSDTSDSYTNGTLTFDAGTTLDINGDLSIADTSIAFDGASTNLNLTGDLTINTDDLVVDKATGYIGLGTATTPAQLSFAASTAPEGGINFGGDTNLYRVYNNMLMTDDEFWSATKLGVDSSGGSSIDLNTSDSAAVESFRFYYNSVLKHQFGFYTGNNDFFIDSYNSSAQKKTPLSLNADSMVFSIDPNAEDWVLTLGGDINLYRNAANVLKSDDSLVVGSNLGVGDDTPDHKLDVAGNIGLSASGYINWGDTDGESGYGFRDNSGTLQFKNSGGSWTDFGSGGSSLWTQSGSDIYYNSGNVGIGTSGPFNERLNVNGRIYIADSSAPGTTTNRLYAVGGVLYWNGIALGGDSGSIYSNSGSIADGSYLSVAHNQDTYDIMSTGWIYDGVRWIEIDDFAEASLNISDSSLVAWYKMEEASGNLDNAEGTAGNDLTALGSATYQQVGKINYAVDFDGTDDAFASSSEADNDDFDFGTGSFSIGGWFKHDTISTSADYIAAKYSDTASVDIGTGDDGAITVSSNTNINTTTLISGRSCTDGGDAVNYSVTALTSNTATLSSSPSTGCLSVGDEVLLINLQGTYSAVVNVGNHETLRVQQVSGNTITFTTNKVNYYGDNVSDDTNIGTTFGTQKVMLQRVPNYTDVTVNSSINFYPSGWNGIKGGVIFFRADGSVSIGGTISANGSGYRGPANSDKGTHSGGDGGEAFCGEGGIGASDSVATTSGAAGGGGRTTDGGNGYCGGGGGGYGGVGTDHDGSDNSGGAGGGAGGHGAGGGGGGYGTAGTGGGGTSSIAGEDGGTNYSGDGYYPSSVYAGGGGGGTYGEPDLDILMFGSGGGEGSENSSGNSGNGGNGGGIIGIYGNAITVSGVVESDGSDGTNASGSYSGGGGGGAGGSIKLAGNTLNLGSGLVNADGGNGGTGYYSTQSDGGDGGDGIIAVEYVSSVTGTTSPTYTGTGVSSGSGGYKLYMESDGDITFGIDDDYTSFPEDSAGTESADYDDNQWHHIVAVKNGIDNLSLYIDGQEVASDQSIASVTSISNDEPFYLGIDSDGSSGAWDGSMDQFFVYSRALDAGEVEELYQSNSRFQIEQYDSNTVRLYNNSGETQSLRLVVSTLGGDGDATFLPSGSTGQTLYYTSGVWTVSSLLYNSGTNIGIGDTSPDHKLDVEGNIGLSASGYINWGDTDGSSGYGFRDNSGTLEYKNSSGSWTPFGGIDSWSDPHWVIESEYEGATLVADGTNNTGTMTSDNAGSSNDWMNYYEFNSSETSLNDYDVRLRFTLPEDFSSWDTNGIVVDFVTESTSTANSQLDLYVYLESSAVLDTSNTGNASSVAGTWETVTISGSSLTDCNDAGETCLLIMRMYSKDDYYTRIGDITFDYVRP